MKFSVKLLRGLSGLVLALVLGGCLPPQSQLEEEKEPHFMAGKNHLKTMDSDAAIASFEKALAVNPRSASAHFELGCLYTQQKPDPAAAIYHYEHYLKLQPNSARAETVRQRILSAKQELARTVSLGPLTDKQQRDLEKLVEDSKRLAEENKRLNEENARWRAYFAAQQRSQTNPPARATPAPATETSLPGQAERASGEANASGRGPQATGGAGLAARPAPPPGGGASAAAAAGGGAPGSRQAPSTNRGPVTALADGGRAGPGGTVPGRNTPSRMHVIKPHETLAGIARQYGLRLDVLTAANPGVNPRRLRPGQTLTVPAR